MATSTLIISSILFLVAGSALGIVVAPHITQLSNPNTTQSALSFLKGGVVNTNDQPLNNTIIVINESSTGNLGYGFSDVSGHYEIFIPKSGTYYVGAIWPIVQFPGFSSS